jgi:AcrR family transcriptional regulator
MANKTEMRPQQGADAVDRAAALRNVMEVLSAKGFAKATIADLKSAVGPGFGALRKAFGTRDEILRAAIRFCADTEVCLAQEPLRVSPTGREAILSMLEENVRLRRHRLRYCGCLFMFNAFVVLPDEAELQDFLAEKRRSISKHIRARLARSVREGELPEDTNCEALANLCLTLLSGLTFRVLDGAPPSLLFRSIELFVKGLGFGVRRNRPRLNHHLTEGTRT